MPSFVNPGLGPPNVTTQYKIDTVVNINAQNLTIDLMGVGLQPLFDESWSIDNFELYTSDNLTYNWSPNGESTSSITVQPTTTTTYTVDVTSGTTTCQDSVTITVNPTHQITVDSTACDSIFWAGNWLATSGTYNDTLQNTVGCDSIVTLNLTMNYSTTGDTTATACDSLVWYGNTYTSTGTYSEMLQTIDGCDSVVTLNLTINPSTPTLIWRRYRTWECRYY